MVEVEGEQNETNSKMKTNKTATFVQYINENKIHNFETMMSLIRI